MSIQHLIRPTIKTLKPYSSARDEYKGVKGDLIFLDANENPFNNGINRYPDPQQSELKSVLSELKSVPIENILLGNGSDEVLDLLIRMFCEPTKDNVVILPPTYGMYEVLANVNAVEILKVNLSAKHFQPQTETILKAANANSKILFLCSPNNPTGNNFDTSTIEKLINSFKGIVVIDEAYIDFSNEKSWLTRLQEFPNLVVTQTLSKAYGMAGIRLGMCFASVEIIATLNKIKAPYNINELTQQKAIELLGNHSLVKYQISCLIEEKDALVKVLGDVDYVENIYPSDANFILIKVDDANKRYQQLIDSGIVIRNRTTQPLCENCLRLTIGTKAENKRLIERLQTL
ncbi:histidinol-phosphate transaminase [Gelidibacter salicanalis]|uniref:Histidinol-phosphate aminotransferase n=1 Tax=Gelidibacter salicanalis TaxID=291193 RepID=A0A934KZT4_9FLAO|nr:histidinol-phosphate transaminase [Gelidibacter salicanalis]MBJ7882670.1 histidinol-phosphate transaminase [Gelidibacter salicanalis]